MGSSQQAAQCWAHSHPALGSQPPSTENTNSSTAPLLRPYQSAWSEAEASAAERARPSTQMVERTDRPTEADCRACWPRGRAQVKDSITVLGPSATKPYG